MIGNYTLKGQAKIIVLLTVILAECFAFFLALSYFFGGFATTLAQVADVILAAVVVAEILLVAGLPRAESDTQIQQPYVES